MPPPATPALADPYAQISRRQVVAVFENFLRLAPPGPGYRHLLTQSGRFAALDEMAATLGLHARTLRRKLVSEGATTRPSSTRCVSSSPPPT